MNIKKIILIMLCTILSSCTDSVSSYFKKSANNKYVDTKGFHGGKRQPLYNKKYISIAKKNISEDNLDEDYYDNDDDNQYNDDIVDPKVRNHLMYMKMIKHDQQKSVKGNKFNKHREKFEQDNESPTLSEVSKKITADDKKNTELQKEIAKIKSMLEEAQKDLVRYRCPMNKDQEPDINNKDNNVKQNNNFNNSTLSKTTKTISTDEVKNNNNNDITNNENDHENHNNRKIVPNAI